MADDGDKLDEDEKAQIVQRIYDVALDPSRYEQLLDLWEAHIAPARRRSAELEGEYEDNILQGHIERANQILARVAEDSGTDAIDAHLRLFLPMAAFAVAEGGTISGANEAARTAFDIEPDDNLTHLPIDSQQTTELRSAVLALLEGRRAAMFVRCTYKGSERPVVFWLMELPVSGTDQKQILITSTELGWRPAIEDLLQDSFELTRAEIDIVKSLVAGDSLNDIADTRSRSVETVRTQLRSIFRKTGVKSQSELARFVFSLMESGGAGAGDAGQKWIAGGQHLEPLDYHSVTLPDGRALEYQVIGDPNGRTILFHGGGYSFTRWPASAERQLKVLGMRVITPIRPGYGNSSPLPRKADRAAIFADDTAFLLDELGVAAAPMVTMSIDSLHGYMLDARHPGRLTAIIGCGPGFPMRTRGDFDRMGKWFSFIYANARYVPAVLPYISMAGQLMIRQMGKKAFMRMVHGHTPNAREVLEDPEVIEAIEVGSDVALSRTFLGHETFAAEAISSSRDWSELMAACDLPQIFYVGDEDVCFPPETVKGIERDFPKLEIIHDPDINELIFFTRWRDVLDRIETYLPSGRPTIFGEEWAARDRRDVDEEDRSRDRLPDG